MSNPDATIKRFIPDPYNPDRPIDTVQLVAAGGLLAGIAGSATLRLIALSLVEGDEFRPNEVAGLLAFARVIDRLDAEGGD